MSNYASFQIVAIRIPNLVTQVLVFDLCMKFERLSKPKNYTTT